VTEQQDRWLRHLAGVIRPILMDRLERDHWQPDARLRRRWIVVAITVVVGAILLGQSFATEQGDPAFYPLTLGVAATWTIGSFASGPLYLGHIKFRGELPRPIITPILVGIVLAAIFAAGALVIRTIPPLASLTEDVIGYARANNLVIVFVILITNGIAEELFFRGALFAAIGVRHPVLISTVIYCLAMLPSGNPVLVFAAAVLGTVVALQRRAGRGVLAPILTHLTWSTAMLFALPPIFADFS
jgi:membrane protease YdiL (CAAX protease family)